MDLAKIGILGHDVRQGVRRDFAAIAAASEVSSRCGVRSPRP